MNAHMNAWQIPESMKSNRRSVENSSLISKIPQKCPSTPPFYPMGTNIDNTKMGKTFIKKRSGKSFTCYVCHKPFPSQADVIMHLKFIHNACASRDCRKIADVRLHSSVCKNRPFDCTVCYKKFPEKFLLQIHFNQHIGAAFHICEICRDGFQQRKDLQKHMLEVHEKNVTVPVTPSYSKRVYQKCCSCSKYFQLFSEYEEHSFMCNNLQKYTCGICKVDFSTLLILESHEYIEHKEGAPVKGFLALKEGKRYFCGICYLGFTKGNILREHLKTHDANRGYICDECHSSFANDDDLQTHYLYHIEEHYVLQDVIRQHLCEVCKKTFKTQKELINHSDSGLCKNVCNESKVNEMSNVANFTSSTKIAQTNRPDSLRTNLSAIGSESLNNTGNIGISLPSKEKTDLNINLPNRNLEADSFGCKPSDYPVYALKAGDELLNCDDANCIIVIDRDSLFVLQRGICASESKIPDVSNAEAYNDSDVIDASLLQHHMFNILNVKDDESLDENTLNSEVNGEALAIVEQKLNIGSDSSEIITINLSELNAQLASDPDFKNHHIYIESVPINESENSENSEMGNSHTYKIIVDDSLEGESNAVVSELTIDEAVSPEKIVPYVNELVKEAVAQKSDLVKMG